jgi:hypothetical protein
MKNSESHTNKDFTVEDLLTRGCTRTLIERFLEPEDYRDPVNHFRNYSGKKMFQRRRVELIEASAHWHRQPLPDEIAEIANGSFKLKEPPEIKNRGFVVRALEAALWAFHHSDSFTEGALRAVNLGDDADTIGAIYGQLAGPLWRQRYPTGLDRASGVARTHQRKGRCAVRLLEHITHSDFDVSMAVAAFSN